MATPSGAMDALIYLFYLYGMRHGPRIRSVGDRAPAGAITHDRVAHGGEPD